MRHPATAHRYDVLYDPGTITLGTILSGIGTAVSVVGSIREGKARQNEADFNAAIKRQEADRERQISASEARKFEREQSALRARSRAVRAGSGVVPTSGTSLLVDEDIASEIARNKALIKAGGETRATRLEQNAALLGLSGRSARTSSFFKAGATALTGAAKFV